MTSGGAGRRPGRIQQIAHDATPLNSATVDLEARLGWLLAMSRLHHPDPGWRDGRTFVTALGDAGVPTSRSLLSRWESGEIPASYEAMAGYERVLQLPAGQLSSVTAYLATALPSVRPRLARPRLDPSTPAFSARFDELIDRCEAGAGEPRDWQDLGWHLTTVPLAHLRRSTWATLCTRLCDELPRTVKLAYRQYTAASFDIAGVPRAQGHLVDAIAAYVADPDVQVITTPAGLLDQLPTRAAAALVLDTVAAPTHDAALRTGVWLATQKLTRGHFTPDERDRLLSVVLTRWRRNPARAAEELAELVAVMPEAMRSALVQAATQAGRRKLGYVVEHGEEVPAAKARVFAQGLADDARDRVPQDAAYAEDRMLTRLVREALFHRDSERRHLASLLLASSPFGTATGSSLLEVLGGHDHSPWVRGRLATLVRYLCDDSHRLRVVALLQDPVEQVRVALAQSLGHLSPSSTSDQSLRLSLGRADSLTERARIYALGMSGSPGLASILRSSAAPEWQRSAARWWLRRGAAIRG